LKYKSLQFHWHSPSEHQINGENADLELHIVHSIQDNDGETNQLAVLGILFSTSGGLSNTLFDNNAGLSTAD